MLKNFQLYLFILFSIIFLNDANSQYIKGKVIEISNEGKEIPLENAKVFWKGSEIHSITNQYGEYKIPDIIDRNESPILLVSLVGYELDSKRTRDNSITFILKSLLNLDEVVIKEKRASTQYSIIEPINLQTLNKKELEKAACCNLSECFETNATVDVSFTNALSGSKKIRMLGLDGKYVKITAESMPLVEGISGSFGINYVPGSWIESIQIIKGPGSVINGYNAMTGQINVEYIEPENGDRLFWNGFLSSEGKFENNLLLAKQKGLWKSNLFTHLTILDTEHDHNNDSYRDMPFIRNFHILNRWKYTGNDFYRFQFILRGLVEDRESGQISEISNPYTINIENKIASFGGKFAFLLPNNLQESIGIQYSTSYHNQKSVYGKYKMNETDESVYVNAIRQLYNSNLNHIMKYGISFDARRLNQKLDGFNTPNESIVFNHNNIVTGLFSEYSTSNENVFQLLGGYRIDYHNKHGLFHSPRINFKYNPNDMSVVRLIAGKSFRISYPLSENESFLASSRAIDISNVQNLLPEEAWNFGINASYCFYLFGKESSINSDLYRTIFSNKVIADIEDQNELTFYNSDKASFSNVWQIDISHELIKNLQIKYAFKINDVQSTFLVYNTAESSNGEDAIVWQEYSKRRDPLVPKYRGMINANYINNSEKWIFDITANYIGPSRIPKHSELTVTESLSFLTYNMQITRKFKYLEAYIGGENLSNYTQENPVLDPNNINDRFDASLIWGPIMGRTFYLGLRYRY